MTHAQTHARITTLRCGVSALTLWHFLARLGTQLARVLPVFRVGQWSGACGGHCGVAGVAWRDSDLGGDCRKPRLGRVHKSREFLSEREEGGDATALLVYPRGLGQRVREEEWGENGGE
ncbi:hypothetical protein E2C01_040608 [Portunus trituberculatus]|uniref:Uncharacterized protein n=1 Tax=Portunus trituberculatus TaxID=210409 RepID=A0A5B7FNG2_PORTR|nr:hypothetical protein [Portunus trituberculatus]